MNAGGFHAGLVIHLREPSLGERKDEEDEVEEGELVGEGREELR